MKTALLAVLLCAPLPGQEKVEVVRDHWGIPHVFAATDAGAMFGLGFASAEDRAFQMYYALRLMQGRLAEVLGDVRSRNGRKTAVGSDRRMRSVGWWSHAVRVAGNLDAGTRRLLAAFSDGVNAWVGRHRGKLPEPFGKLGVVPEPWTPAACLVSWWHVARFFGPDGTRDLIGWRNVVHPRPGRPAPVRVGPDDAVAVVRRADVSAEWVARVAAFAAEHYAVRPPERTGKSKKFSHAWVVGGSKTTTGAAVLVSDPQTPVTNPNLFWEFHVQGETLDARGIGVAGSPLILIGFTRQVAWGMTARGADQADLFRLATDPRHPDAYRLDGRWRPMQVRREEIRVRGDATRTLEVRTTVFGPVVSEFCFRRTGEPEVAVKRVPLSDDDVDTVQAAFAMMRARTVREFARALDGWRFPTANCLYGDRNGSIGYSTIGAIPVRSKASPSLGRAAHQGDSLRFDWQGFVPGPLMPQCIDPKRGYILSANHRPIASFYTIPIGGATGVGGETLRSWRLRERLRAKQEFTPADVLAIHRDTVDPAQRDIAGIGFHMRDRIGIELGAPATRALAHLEGWYRHGGSSDLRQPGAALASRIRTNFRQNATPLAATWGGGQSGLARFLKAASARFARKEVALVEADEWDFVERLLGSAWRSATARWGRDPSRWGEAARKEVAAGRLGWFAGLDGFGSVDAAGDVAVPALFCVDGNTIQSQRAQSYTQWVPLDAVDSALSICPIGQSERLDGRWRLSTYRLWERGDLHPAPLSREAVRKIESSRSVLTWTARR